MKKTNEYAGRPATILINIQAMDNGISVNDKGGIYCVTGTIGRCMKAAIQQAMGFLPTGWTGDSGLRLSAG